MTCAANSTEPVTSMIASIPSASQRSRASSVIAVPTPSNRVLEFPASAHSLDVIGAGLTVRRSAPATFRFAMATRRIPMVD